MTRRFSLLGKRRQRYLVMHLLVLLILSLMTLPVFAEYEVESLYTGITVDIDTENEGIIHVEYRGNKLTAGKQYAILAVAGTKSNYNLSADSLLYIDQKEASTDSMGAAISFDVYPSVIKDSVILLAGNINSAPAAVSVAEVVVNRGYEVVGKITAYNPQTSARVILINNDEIKYFTLISADSSGSGEYSKSFKLEGVAPGTYDLLIKKDGHLDYTVKGLTVTNSNVDLTTDSRAEISVLKLLCGDINNDMLINSSDVAEIRSPGNYYKPIDLAGNRLCDLDGDGICNSNDAAIVRFADNYFKNANDHCTVNYGNN